MLAELGTLIDLQQTDRSIAALNAQIEALPNQIGRIEAELRDFLQAYENHKQRLAANQKERRDLDSEIQLIQTKISRHKEQLYQVKTNEQYRALQHEIDGEEANIRKIEDQILDKMMEAEELEGRVKSAAARLESEKSRVASEVSRLRALSQTDEDERRQLQLQREALSQMLSPAVRELYERLRSARQGLAVARVQDGSCGACHVRLRPQPYNEVRSGTALVTCATCGRILYYVEPPSVEMEPAPTGSSATDQRA